MQNSERDPVTEYFSGRSQKMLSSKDLEAFHQRVRENVKKHFLHAQEGGENPGNVAEKKKRKRKPRNNKFKGWPTKSRLTSESADDRGVNTKPLGDGTGSSTEKSESSSKGSGEELATLEGLANERKSKKRRNKGTLEMGKVKPEKGKDMGSGVTPTEEDMAFSQDDSLPSESKPQAAPETIYAVAKKKRKRELPAGNPREHWDHQLRGARFRFINEALYRTSGDEAFQRFSRDKSAFEAYFEGYNQQVTDWPENPLDVIINYLNSSPQAWVIGDFGCGEAKLAQSVKQKVHSFDMFPTNKRVTVCNISKVPLKPESLDVAVYCLSLMGTNWTDYLQEACRVLRKGGILKIAEVASRFKSVGLFINVLNKLGFTLKNKNLTNKMFYLFDFVKAKQCKYVKTSLTNILKPCEYKRR